MRIEPATLLWRGGAFAEARRRDIRPRLAKDLARAQGDIDVTNRVDVTLAMKSRVQNLGR